MLSLSCGAYPNHCVSLSSRNSNRLLYLNHGRLSIITKGNTSNENAFVDCPMVSCVIPVKEDYFATAYLYHKNNSASSSNIISAQLWELNNNNSEWKCIRTYQTRNRNQSTHCLAFSPNSEFVAVLESCSDRHRFYDYRQQPFLNPTITVFHVGTEEIIVSIDVATSLLPILFSFSWNHSIVALSTEGNIEAWKFECEKQSLSRSTIRIPQTAMSISCATTVKQHYIVVGGTHGDIFFVLLGSNCQPIISPVLMTGVSGLSCLAVHDGNHMLSLILGNTRGELTIVRVDIIRWTIFKATTFLTSSSSHVHFISHSAKEDSSNQAESTYAVSSHSNGDVCFISIMASSISSMLIATGLSTKPLHTLSAAFINKSMKVCLPSNDILLACVGNAIKVFSLRPNPSLHYPLLLPSLTVFVTGNVFITAMDVTNDGYAIVSGWSDGQLRVFSPLTAKLMWNGYLRSNSSS